ncbi:MULTISPECIES: hypothetical protein [Larkinella]|uniref:Uncharacterized protein n=1 Tax=Larkinella punicea TaxID=2315727 RepID=A0A368JG98_9BACT|nr:hypothetical protein [Larkinella punicea]RCR66677.1 hypothetical protein DUE52_25600 [Larkinella punicea]
MRITIEIDTKDLPNVSVTPEVEVQQVEVNASRSSATDAGAAPDTGVGMEESPAPVPPTKDSAQPAADMTSAGGAPSFTTDVPS